MTTDSAPPADLLRAAGLLENSAERATAGDWQVRGLLASRPEVVAVRSDGSTEHVAEARAASSRWITLFSPALAPSLAAWLRSAAETDPVDEHAVAFARYLLGR